MPNASVDKNAYIPQNMLDGTNILVLVGPPLYTDVTDTGSQPLQPIGLIQGLEISTGRPQRQAGEIGSKAKYLLSSRGGRQMGIGRIMTDEANVLKALYRWHILKHQIPPTLLPGGIVWTDLDHPLFKNPIGVQLTLRRIEADGTVLIHESVYLNNVTVSSIGAQVAEGERGMMENVAVTWTHTDNIN